MAETEEPNESEKVLAGLVSGGILLVGQIVYQVFRLIFGLLSALVGLL